MRLFHGTNVDFEKIDLSKTNPFKDFGRGFYLTDIENQACELAKKRAIRDGGTPIVQIYEVGDTLLKDESLSVKVFEGASAEWAEFVFNNRNRNNIFLHNFDIVVGPIADDGVAYLLGRYQEGSFTLDELAAKLKFKKLNNQYFFGTQRALSFLKRIK